MHAVAGGRATTASSTWQQYDHAGVSELQLTQGALGLGSVEGGRQPRQACKVQQPVPAPPWRGNCTKSPAEVPPSSRWRPLPPLLAFLPSPGLAAPRAVAAGGATPFATYRTAAKQARQPRKRAQHMQLGGLQDMHRAAHTRAGGAATLLQQGTHSTSVLRFFLRFPELGC